MAELKGSARADRPHSRTSGHARIGTGAVPLVLIAFMFAILPTMDLPLQLGLCAPAIALFGLPHGATDWQLAEMSLRSRLGPLWPLPFVAAYGALMGTALLAAALAPYATMIAFLAVSIVHFGAEDARALRLPAGIAGVVACGTLPILAPALFWPGQYAAILFSLGITIAAANVHIIGAIALCIWALAAVRVLVWPPAWRPAVFAEWTTLLILSAVAPPLVTFTAYFCVLHAPRHIAALPFAPRARPVAAVSVAAIILLAAGALMAASWHGNDLVWASTNAIFWGLAALTLPHVTLGWFAAHLVPGSSIHGRVSAGRQWFPA